MSIRLYFDEYVQETDEHLFTTWTSFTWQKLINFSVTLNSKSPIFIITEFRFSYACHKLSMYLAYSLCTAVSLNAADFFPSLFWQKDFTISIYVFTSASLEFNCQSCSSTNPTSERLPANSNPMWPKQASLHFQGIYIFHNCTTWMSSTPSPIHRPSITDSCSLIVVIFKFALTMSI